MTAFEKEVTEALAELKKEIQYIKEHLQNDYKALHGNGVPGLIQRVSILEHNTKWIKYLIGLVTAGLGYLASNLKDQIK